MSYIRRILGLGVLLLMISLVVFVPLAAAYETDGMRTGEQVVSNIGMFQDATPTVTTTVEATVEAGGEAPAATVEAQATPGVTEPQQGAQPATQPGTLPQTGGVVVPWTTITLMVVGGLILAGGLALALTRRSR